VRRSIGRLMKLTKKICIWFVGSSDLNDESQSNQKKFIDLLKNEGFCGQQLAKCEKRVNF